jgi:hypothetical protein
LQALATPRQSFLPLEILSPQPERLERADEQRPVGPGGRFGNTLRKVRAIKLLSFGARIHCITTPRASTLAASVQILRIEVPRAGKIG